MKLATILKAISALKACEDADPGAPMGHAKFLAFSARTDLTIALAREGLTVPVEREKAAA